VAQVAQFSLERQASPSFCTRRAKRKVKAIIGHYFLRVFFKSFLNLLFTFSRGIPVSMIR